jgi:hypothetical protein
MFSEWILELLLLWFNRNWLRRSLLISKVYWLIELSNKLLLLFFHCLHLAECRSLLSHCLLLIHLVELILHQIITYLLSKWRVITVLLRHLRLEYFPSTERGIDLLTLLQGRLCPREWWIYIILHLLGLHLWSFRLRSKSIRRILLKNIRSWLGKKLISKVEGRILESDWLRVLLLLLSNLRWHRECASFWGRSITLSLSLNRSLQRRH